MTEQVQTEPSYARPASDASERAASISAGAALGKPPGPVRFSTSRRRTCAANVQIAPCISTRLIS